MNGAPVGLVVARLKDELERMLGKDLLQLAGCSQGKIFSLHYARAADDGERLILAHKEVFYGDILHKSSIEYWPGGFEERKRDALKMPLAKASRLIAS